MPSSISAKSSKYPILVEHLRGHIARHALSAGDRLPSFAALQEKFAVTPNTVNRALMELQREGIIERRRGSGIFVADKTALRPEKLRQHTVGVAGLGFGFSDRSAYWSAVLGGMRGAALQQQTQLLLMDGAPTMGWEKVDGLLVCEWVPQIAPHIPAQLPTVSLLCPALRGASAYADERGGTRAATEHLLALGHRRIAFLHGNDNTVTPLRRAGYEEALRAQGIAPQKQWKRALQGKNDVGEEFIRAGYAAMQAWLRKGWKQSGCTALLAYNDETALGAMQALAEAGFRVPRDVSVVGFDGIELGGYSGPHLTTVELPLRDMAAAALNLLVQQIERDQVCDEHIVLPTTLRVRQTTAPLHK